ncbi:MAG TPA: hypothetical protein PKD67_07830 [Ignavibacteriaceae bacterium]|jgi:hypothetical protein|nr:hypothetical protein [Ignavibacteriaceae bacterium]
MKNIFLFALATIFTFIFISCGDNSKNDNQNPENGKKSNFQKRYGVKSGIIEYDLSGVQEGTKTLYFDDWGMRQAEYTRSVISVSGYTKAVNLVTIIDGEYQYTINLDQKTGTKTRNPIIKEMETLKYEKGFNEFGEQMILKMGAEKVGSENFLGKNCDVYEIKKSNTKLWVWNWITLKSEVKSRAFDISTVATKIETDVPIPSSKFAVPEKIVLNEVDLDNLENEMREENK